MKDFWSDDCMKVTFLWIFLEELMHVLQAYICFYSLLMNLNIMRTLKLKQKLQRLLACFATSGFY